MNSSNYFTSLAKPGQGLSGETAQTLSDVGFSVASVAIGSVLVSSM